MENYSTLSRDKTFRKRSLTLVVFGIIAIALLYGIVFTVQNYFAGSQTTGEAGSSYATVESGNRAWSELLSANDIKITRDRGKATFPDLDNIESYGNDISSLRLDRRTQTVVVLAGALPLDEAQAVQEFVRDGGRLITDNPLLLDDVLGDRVSVSQQGAVELFPSSDDVPGMDDIEEIEGSGVGSVTFNSDNQSQALLTSDADSFESFEDSDDFNSGSFDQQSANAAIFQLGDGDVIALVDTGIVSNKGLVRKDNALFSLRIAGSEGSSVTFIEGLHGFSEARGFAGMPLSWRIAIIGLFVAFVVFGCAQGRRFGVGEEPNRDLGPRRIFFAQAISQALKKSKG